MKTSSAKMNFNYSNFNRENITVKKINFNNIENNNTNNNFKLINNSENLQNTSRIPGNISNNQANPNKISCTCTKTNCKKKYCACFANGKFCEGCQCENCENKGIQNTLFGNNIEQLNIICNCTKSNCKKKYCECYKSGKECTWLCRCVNCENCISRKIKCEEFSIEALGIEISNKKIYINRRNVSANLSFSMKDDIFTPLKLNGRKRQRFKQQSTNQSTNFKTPLLDSTKNRASSTNKKQNTKRKYIPRAKKLEI